MGRLVVTMGCGDECPYVPGRRYLDWELPDRLPLVLAASSVAIAAGTLSLVGIAQAWQPWWLLWQAPAAFVLLVAGLAELQRPPFDMPIADSELVFGYMTEYTGLRFAFFLLAEYVGIVVIAAEPRELTIVHISGNLDPEKLAELGGDFGIPRFERGHWHREAR